MNSVMLASFTEELQKIAGGNVAAPAMPTVGGMGGNAMGKPLPSTGMSKGMAGTKPQPAQTTNYTMVNTTAPTAAYNAGAQSKMTPPPPVRT